MQAYIGELKIDENARALVIPFSGCDFKCPYCFTPKLTKFNEEEFLKDLKEIKQMIYKSVGYIDKIFFTGGEPCIQRQALLNLVEYAKDRGLIVHLHTNASKPDCLRHLFKFKLIDKLIIDLKSPLRADIFEKTTESKTFFITTESIMRDIYDSLDIIKQNSNVEVEVRTTIVPGLMYRKEDILEIAALIKDMKCTFVLQAFDNEKKVLDKKLQKINPPSQIFLLTLKEAVQKKYASLVVEVK